MTSILHADQSAFSADVVEMTPDDIQDIKEEIMRRTARHILVALYGPALGGAVFADLLNEADAPNSALAPELTRAAVSKVCCRLRRGLGLPLRNPNNRRGGRQQ